MTQAYRGITKDQRFPYSFSLEDNIKHLIELRKTINIVQHIAIMQFMKISLLLAGFL